MFCMESISSVESLSIAGVDGYHVENSISVEFVNDFPWSHSHRRNKEFGATLDDHINELI